MFNSFEHRLKTIALRLCDDAYVAWLQAETEEAAARELERLWAVAHLSGRLRRIAGDGVAPDHWSGDPWSYTSRDSADGWSARKAEPWPLP